jgi:hypothetical protein
MSEVRLGWSEAEVKDARLTVALDGELPEGWKEDFERTVKLLGDGGWGEITLKKDSVQVASVTPGTEDKLRHHLEAIIAQANAADEARRRESEPGDEDDRGKDSPSGPDAEMTARFRAFAEDPNASEGSEKKEDSDGE